MADTPDDIENQKSYLRGFNDSRNQRPYDDTEAGNQEFYKLGYEDGEKDD